MNRKDWSAAHPGCWLCPGPASETHEIACGPGRAAALKEPAAWVRACYTCHQGNGGLHDYPFWPIARQLALKWVMDPRHYNPEAVNVLRGRQPNAITHDDVMKQVPYVVMAWFRNGVPLERIEERLDERDERAC